MNHFIAAGSCSMCCDPDELSEQGLGLVQHSHCQPNLLCHVYHLHNHSFCHLIPGKVNTPLCSWPVVR